MSSIKKRIPQGRTVFIVLENFHKTKPDETRKILAKAFKRIGYENVLFYEIENAIDLLEDLQSSTADGFLLTTPSPAEFLEALVHVKNKQ